MDSGGVADGSAPNGTAGAGHGRPEPPLSFDEVLRAAEAAAVEAGAHGKQQAPHVARKAATAHVDERAASGRGPLPLSVGAGGAWEVRAG